MTTNDMERLYDYNSFLRGKFGQKVYKICLDSGFSCPNIDGTRGKGGCIYCNNKSFSPPTRDKTLDISQQLDQGMRIGRNRYKAHKFIAYFQSYTNTHAPVQDLRQLYHRAVASSDVVGIAIGTRPDAVDSEKIDLLGELAEKMFVSIEYGVQTMNEQTLQWIERGHGYESFLDAVSLTQRYPKIHICAHVMFGFPDETREEMLGMAYEMNRIRVHGVKLHNLLIVQNTRLARIFERQPFPLFEYEEYIDLVCDFLERLSPRIVVERLCASAPDPYLIAPKYGKSMAQVAQDVRACLKERQSRQGIFT
ncbi:MAG: TIGR01212 family radical SAM protein [Candidatus Cloacimonetes bacterium 4572_55]|nr:MAG: TIGR01212 family radical SAM protein [Candidatus Cloacimonetes bacterium 4572_55]